MTPGEKIATAVDHFVAACRQVEKDQDPHRASLVAAARSGKAETKDALASVLDEALAGRGAAADEYSDPHGDGECIGLMRWHLAEVGIEATFADDAAAFAAAEIKRLRALLDTHGIDPTPPKRPHQDVRTRSDLELPVSTGEAQPTAPAPDPLREGLLGLDEEELLAMCGEQWDELRLAELQAVLALIAKAKEGGR